MYFKIVNDLDEAKKIWDFFSPHKTIDDEWDFRFAFFKFLPYKLSFVIGVEENKPVTLLPLQENNLEGLMPPYYSGNKPFLEFFGGDDTDSNKIFGKQTDEIFQYLKTLDIPVFLAPLGKSYEKEPGAEFYEKKYILDFKDYENHEDFLDDLWSTKSAKKLEQLIRKIYREHKVEILVNNYEDLDLIEKFNIQRFKDASSFRFPYRIKIFKHLTKLYKVLALTIVIDGIKEAVSYGIIYKYIYIGMNAGVNSNISDLPKLLIMAQIDKAIEMKCKSYDAGKGDSGWKESFKLASVPQYKLTV